MNIKSIKDNKKINVVIEGRLDTITSPEFERFILNETNDIEELVIDMSELEYISSAGLRVVLLAHKRMMKQGTMLIKGANESILEVFDITGFIDILNIEK